MIKVIALDIDGTITDSNRQLDVTSVEPIRRAVKSGITACLATGNILCHAQTTAALLGINGPLIAEDGGIVYDREAEKEYQLGDSKKAEKGVELLKKKLGNIQPTSYSNIRRAERTIERTISADEASKILRENNTGLEVVDSKFALHIREIGVNKGKALEKVSTILNYPLSEIAAIGDSENDVEMLRKAGLSFAPSNASQEAKEACDHVTEGSHGSGVKEAIEKILSEK
ncbi:hypothetical protein AKJ51_02680 [candidate division MSBL1 archaeon SCGC-AAA382A20]|uniref:Phosphoglycolate phosphatase n=1 Tax=candidate division MSBL1 archaeon SCGC-AAA382A20 TaxID=1698280 RepID=A0A133VK66_9EURY|nr:hypothetical protein AKJ51_02680 [candidate division MSBL1 archaeon SCGC-AAA382A20]